MQLLLKLLLASCFLGISWWIDQMISPQDGLQKAIILPR